MCIKDASIYCLGLLLFCAVGGCEKSDSGSSASNSRPAINEPVATVHWIGSKRLATLSNAAGFLKIWRLPETVKLQAQTLDKLALAPWGSPVTNNTATSTNWAELVRANPSAALLRPLFDDLLQEGFYLEMRDAGSATCQMGLSVRLDQKRAGLWEKNLASVFETAVGSRKILTPAAGTSKGWSITSASKVSPMLRHIELAQAGEWIILGLASDQNEVFTELLGRIQRNQAPFPTPATGDWLQTALDLRRLSVAFSWALELPEDWPRISLGITGDGTNVLTRGKFKFAKAVPFEIEPWNIPTNLIHEPVNTFTAVQGLKHWLSSWAWWKNTHASAPNQIFFWGQNASPFFEYAAAPLADAPKAMAKLGPAIMDSMSGILASNRMGKWERADSDAVNWVRAPIMAPLVQSTALSQGNFLFAGLSPLTITNSRPPSGTLRQLASQRNAVYFDREFTGPRVEAWLNISQLFRLVLRREQLPSESAPVLWLKAGEHLLGSSTTTLTKSSQTELSLVRSSSVGLTGVELLILADWLESSQFPFHLHSTVAKFPPLPPRRPLSN